MYTGEMNYPQGYWFKITTGNNWTLNAGIRNLHQAMHDFPHLHGIISQ